MALPIKLNTSHNKIKLKAGKSAASSDKYSLPVSQTEPAENLIDYTYLIYGRKKIGKTSLVARFPGAIFFMFEPGTKAQKVFKLPKDGGCFIDWKDVKGYTRMFRMKSHDFITACFDPGNKAYDLCLKYVCAKEGISHPGKMKDFGASWKAVSSEFESIHMELANAGMAFVVLAHEKWNGDRGMIEPKFSPSTEDFYEGVIDNIFYYHYVNGERFLQIRGTDNVVAGTRCENHFLTKDGDYIYKIPMGSSADEAWENLNIAWDNEQDESYEPETEGGAKKKKKKLILKKSR